MHYKRLITLLAALPAIVLFSACSGGGGSNNDGGTTTDGGGTTTDGGTTDGGATCVSQNPITFSGTVEVHPASLMIAGTNPPSLANTTLTLSPAAGLLSGNQPYLTYSDAACTPVTGPLTPNTGDATKADYSYANVSPDTVSLGVIAVVDNASGSSTYIKTATGIAAPPSGGASWTDVTGSHVFAVTAATEAALDAAEGKPTGTLLKNGFVLGVFLDKTGAPMAGVKVADSNGPVSDAFYPTADFSSTTTTGTSSTGVFVLPTASLTAAYTGQDAANDTFDKAQAATLAGSVYVIFLTQQ